MEEGREVLKSNKKLKTHRLKVGGLAIWLLVIPFVLRTIPADWREFSLRVFIRF